MFTWKQSQNYRKKKKKHPPKNQKPVSRKKFFPLDYFKVSFQPNIPLQPNILAVRMCYKQGHCPPLPEYNHQRQEIITDMLLPCNPRIPFTFCQMSLCVHSQSYPSKDHALPQPPFSLVSWLEQFLRLVLTFMTFTLLKITAKILQECPATSSGLDSDHTFLAEIS